MNLPIDINRLMSPEAVSRIQSGGLHKLAAAMLRQEGFKVAGDEASVPELIRALGTKLRQKNAQYSKIMAGLQQLKEAGVVSTLGHAAGGALGGGLLGGVAGAVGADEGQRGAGFGAGAREGALLGAVGGGLHAQMSGLHPVANRIMDALRVTGTAVRGYQAGAESSDLVPTLKRNIRDLVD